MTLFDEVARVAAERAEQCAIRAGAESVTYSELLRRANELADALERAGVGAGQPVASLLPGRPELLVALLASARVGAAFVPLEHGAPAAEHERVSAAFGGGWHVITGADGRLPDGSALRLGASVAEDRLAPLEPLEALRDVGMVQTTSGSTGAPKCILLSDAALVARVRNLASALELGPDDRTLCAIPLSHSHGIDCLALPSLLSGGCLYLHPPQAAAPNTVLRLIERERITFFSSMPSFYELATKLVRGRGYDLGALRLPFCASAALRGPTAEAFERAFGVAIRQGYGLAEIGPVTLNLDVAATRKFDSIGTPMPGVRCRIATDGELVVSSESLASGYLGAPDEWAERVRDGELHTQDLVRADDTGHLYIEGRATRVLNVDGMQVHPNEIEDSLAEVDWVAAVAVVGAVDATAGERPVAHVVRAAGAPALDAEAAAALEAHLRSRLAAYKIPARFVFRRDLPTSALGKVRYEALRSED